MLGRSGVWREGHVIDCLCTNTGIAAAAPHENERRAGQADHHPHYDTDQQVVAPPPPAGGERVEQEDTPLHTDAHLKNSDMKNIKQISSHLLQI